MTRKRAARLAIRAGAILALTALGLAIALIAWQERLASAAIEATSGPTALLGIGAYLRIAILLLLIGAASLILMIVLLTRVLPATPDRLVQEQAIGHDAAEQAAAVLPASADLPMPLARMGHLMSVGSLIRGFCHELTNELGPVQGYAELLCDDTRLSELHRRQVARIRDATRTALDDIRGFGAALGWSSDPAQVTQLGEMAAAAARAAQATVASRIELELPTGSDVDVIATEAEVGQAILHLCAAAIPLLGKHEARIRMRVDSIVGANTTADEDVAVSGQRLEIWSDPIDPERTKVQFGALRPSWRYGRVRVEFEGRGWPRDLVGRMFDIAQPDGPAAETGAMALLGALMVEAGGAIMVDTCPQKQTTATLLWPARIAPEVGAPLELDADEDELDALVIHGSEAAAEDLSRRLTAFGLRVASTTSTDSAVELVAEMGPRCHAIVLAQSNDGEIADRLQGGAARPRIIRFDAVMETDELERLAAELRRPEVVT